MSTFIKGASATVSIGSTALQFNGVSIDSGKNEIDVSCFGVTFRQYLLGLKELRGTLSGFAQTGASNNSPLADIEDVSIVITFATGCTVTFTGSVSRRTVGTGVDQGVGVQLNFVNTGSSVTVAWA